MRTLVSMTHTVLLACSLLLCALHTTAIVTPCTEYNSWSATGSGNCIECTSIGIPAADPAQSDYVMVQDRNGDYFPVLRPSLPSTKKTAQTCLWCPETQLCGHPSDYRVFCPAPTPALPRDLERKIETGATLAEAAFGGSFLQLAARVQRRRLMLRAQQSQEPKWQSAAREKKIQDEVLKQRQEQQAAKNRNPRGGWVSRKQCLDSPTSTRKRYDMEMKSIQREFNNIPTAEREKVLGDEAKRSRHSSEMRVRESVGLSDYDGSYNCFGDCVLTGPSGCSAETKKIMPPTPQYVDDPTGVASVTYLKPSNGEPVACQFTVPSTGGTQAYKAMGTYSPSKDNWETCQLIPCQIWTTSE